MADYREHNPTNYKAEIWFMYPRIEAEDELEEQFREFLKSSGMYLKGGPVVFKINYPA